MALDLFANFERASNNSIFYRSVTLPSTYFIVYKVDDIVNKNFNSNNYVGQYSLNNGPFQTFSNLVTGVGITITTVPTICSFTASLTSTTLSTDRYNFTLSAIFVDNFLSASNFTAYPSGYFVNAYTREDLQKSEVFLDSPGMSFYGEGHTEFFFLSALPSPGVQRYVWKFGEYTNSLFSTLSGTNSQLSSAVVSVTSDIGFYPKIPIQLQATNTSFPSTAPGFYFDDTTGESKQYPWFVSTTDYFNNETSTNTRFRESIRVLPYDITTFNFKPGAPSTVYLPINGSEVNYTASIEYNFSPGLNVLEPCYEKYGIVWKWSNFEGCLTATDTFVDYPSSWASTQCLISAGLTGTIGDPNFFTNYAKRWRYEEPGLEATLLNKVPIFCSGGLVTWNLSSLYWERPPHTISAENISEYSYFLQLSGYGTELFTTSFYNKTPVLLTVERPVSCTIFSRPFDWKIKTTTVSASHIINSIPPPVFKLYTPNRYVLTGVPVNFENLTQGLNLLSALQIDFGDGTGFKTYLNSDVYQNFTTSYSSIGIKTVKMRGITTYDTVPITFNFPDLLTVVSQYDVVNENKYNFFEDFIKLPYSEKIQIAANDLIVADVFNSCIEKFYTNLQYLENKNQVYPNTFSDYFGWLGPQPILILEGILSACPQATWADVNCNINPNTTITWFDAATSITHKGDFSDCGTWERLKCGTRTISPQCYGLYNINWDWRSRKARNAEKPVIWKETRCNSNRYPKKWYYEPSQSQQPIVCNDGVWNVNIPRINDFYDPIGNCQTQRQCWYTGIVSKNNILYTAQTTQIRILSSDYSAEFFSSINLINTVTSFNSIKNICIDSEGKIIVLDSGLGQIAIYTINESGIWKLFTTFGSFGISNNRTQFFKPNDMHVDLNDTIWVTDSGNKTLKQFTNTGIWIQTIQNEIIKQATPLSVCVDSQNRLHVLTTDNIKVLTIDGELLYTYEYKPYITGNAIRINTSYNREVIYLCTDTQVIKFFRNGIFNGYIIRSKDCVNNITSIYQDEFRNLLVTTNDKILKFSDLMQYITRKGALPDYYWKLEDLILNSEEYVQSFVYNRCLQRLWDNIELLRSTIYYIPTNRCKRYEPPKYSKSDIIVGQNEIVTSTVINRSFSYLWENLISLLKYFDLTCQE